MIRDNYAHVRFPSFSKKISHRHFILPEDNVKEAFTLHTSYDNNRIFRERIASQKSSMVTMGCSVKIPPFAT